MDDQAVMPESGAILPEIDDSEIVESEAIDDAHQSEKELAAISNTKGWQRIASKMREDVEGLRTGAALQIDDKTPLEIVGQRFVIASSVATKLQEYLNMVDGATEATVAYERRKANKPAAE